MTIRIIDGNNVLRRKVEELGPTALTQLYVEAVVFPAGETAQIWVWDGENAKKARQAIYPGYKANRAPAPDEFYRTMETFRQLLRHSNALQVCVPEFEADDVIAALVRDSNADQPILIDSNDQDFVQLMYRPNVKLAYVSEKTVSPTDMRLYKTLVGDAADEMKGLSRFGAGAWAKLTDEQKILLEEHVTGEQILTVERAQEELNFTPAMATKLVESQEELSKFWDIIGFINVPFAYVQHYCEAGVKNTDAAQKVFQELALLPTQQAA